MAAVRLKVLYNDGREITTAVPLLAQVMTERHYHGMPDTMRVELSSYLAWAALRIGGQETADFEDWLGLVADIDETGETSPEQDAADG